MTDPLEGLRKVLALEESKKYSNTAVVGGLDGYLQRFVSENQLPPSHPVARVLEGLPRGGGYRDLHPITRKRVIDQLLRAAAQGRRTGSTPTSPSVEPPPVAQRRVDRPQPAPPKAAVSRPSAAAPARAASPVIGTLDSKLSVLAGISRVTETKLARINITTVRDLLYHFPTRYHDYSEVRPIADLRVDEEQTVIGDIWSVSATTIGRKKATEAIVSDRSGTIRVLWWSGHWMARRLRQGMRVALSGKITAYRGRLQMEGPELESLTAESLSTRRLVPVYGATENIDVRQIRTWVKQAVDAFADKMEETLPHDVRKRHRLPSPSEALRQVHFPESASAAEAGRRRFAFEELLHIELGVVRRRREWQAGGAAPRLTMPDTVRDGFVKALPFELTGAQRKAMDEVFADITQDAPMSRLIEGDVGAGKTVVAAAALLAAVANGYQGAIMAPTEILAEQHFQTFKHILKGDLDADDVDGGALDGDAQAYARVQPSYMKDPVRIALLKGGLSAERKRAAQEGIASGDVSIAIGTHALVQESVGFARLGLVVVDEQHRFGVEQRGALREKGDSPHMLVMTATPIPRTLALTVYGDLDITVVNEMPPGRPPVKTWRVTPQQRNHAYNFLRNKIAERKQAYVIFPLVEESEAIQARAAVQEYERLSKDVFPGLRLGLLHGRMPALEKDAVMQAFRDHRLDVLVSTAVVEVGVDVPNATVILIEGADRFGLAQLHQFRGRVRRSSEQAFCFLLSENTSSDAVERLQIMETTNDGFKLAEEDLRLRGPGEYFGTRQSGLPDLKVARLTDVKLIEEARTEASRLLDADPELSRPEHAALRTAMERLWGRISAEVS
ncbi:MAG TPA: ATP-dependent DNA helicase RecG [Dehalococcoidia bacterium]|nr:ATP-dependent DNA helicase RecG [Dehalococcoidia bacterium]